MDYRSSAGNLRDFIAGPVWHDMQTEINGSIEQMRNGLELAKDFESVIRLQECIETLRRILVMPEVILGDMAEDKTLTEEENGR